MKKDKYTIHKMDNVRCQYVVFDEEKKEIIAEFPYRESDGASAINALQFATTLARSLNQ